VRSAQSNAVDLFVSKSFFHLGVIDVDPKLSSQLWDAR
jgi:hypothetical protein